MSGVARRAVNWKRVGRKRKAKSIRHGTLRFKHYQLHAGILSADYSAELLVEDQFKDCSVQIETTGHIFDSSVIPTDVRCYYVLLLLNKAFHLRNAYASPVTGNIRSSPLYSMALT